MSYIPVPLSAFGLPGDAQLPGLCADAEHPFLPRVMPYQFNVDVFRVLQFAWLREVNRAEHKPRRGVWLSGPKGAGKTTVIEQFFARLRVPVASVTCNREFRVADAIQTKTLVPSVSKDAEGNRITNGMTVIPIDGPLAIAMRDGFPLILNELDLADPGELTGLNDIIDRGFYIVPDTGEVIHAARGFMVFVSANSNGGGDLSGEYAGVGTMNTAMMSRFFKFSVGYPTEEEEMAVLQASCAVTDPVVAQKVCTIAALIRSAYASGSDGLTSPISTREVIDIVEAVPQFAHLAARGISPVKYAFGLCYANGLSPEAKQAVEQIVERVAA